MEKKTIKQRVQNKMMDDKIASSIKQLWKHSIEGVMNPPRVIKESIPTSEDEGLYSSLWGDSLGVKCKA